VCEIGKSYYRGFMIHWVAWVEIKVSLVTGLVVTPEGRDLVRVRQTRKKLKDLSVRQGE
jgi:hypothetical protein